MYPTLCTHNVRIDLKKREEEEGWRERECETKKKERGGRERKCKTKQKQNTTEEGEEDDSGGMRYKR